MKSRLIIDGNAVYEIDEECLEKKKKQEEQKKEKSKRNLLKEKRS
ncbi:MAG: hypothetical protein ACLT46_07330 [Hungatella sp.]